MNKNNKTISKIAPLGQSDSTGQVKPKRRIFSIVWKVVLLLLFVFGVLSSLAFWSRLTLNVSIEEELFTLQEEIEVAVDQSLPDISLKVIPGKIFEDSDKKWLAFPATGSDSDEAKSRGTITVYNKHTPARLITLIADTRFLSSNGKTFLAVKKVYLPAAKVSGREVIPGSIEVEVIAQQAGDSYNIEATSFSVPGLLGDALYHSVWAESEEAMTGGDMSYVKKVTEQDIENAKAELREKLELSIIEKLEKQAPEGFIFADKAMINSDFKAVCFQKPGTVIDEFNCEGELFAEWIGFQLKDAKILALDFISSNLPFVDIAREETVKLDFSTKTVIASEEKMVLTLGIEAQSYTPLNENIFLSRVAGEKEEEINKIILEHYSQIKEVEFEFWPFWVSKAPSDITRIKIQVNFFDPNRVD